MSAAGHQEPDESVTGTGASREEELRRQQEQDIALHSATSALERVRAEALQYRKERDELRRRLVEARREASEGTSASKALGRDLARLQRRLESLQSGRAHRSAALVRKVRRGLRRRMTVSVKPRSRASITAGPSPKMLPALAEPPVVVPFAEDARRDDPGLLAERAVRAAASAERLAGVATQGRRLRVAAIVDEFTRRCLRLECDLVDLHPDTWQEELEAADVDLLFVESAWRGHEGTWHNAVHRRPAELLALLEHCRERGVPTAFWNKEDPVHFHTFLDAAAEFDHVFTTDADRVPHYRDALGHDRVHLLPFAAQPRLHNPVEGELPRKDAMVFAGGYYTRYTERMRDLDALLEGASSVVPVEIFDRMLGTTHDAYRFPERYEQYVVGSLDPSRIDYAYKGYRFALNLNSVKQSQSMFARRAYELLASGTVTLSNYARGLRVMLGDLVPMTDGSARAAEIVAGLRDDAVRYDRLRLMGLRKVHAEHTYRERLRYVVAAVTGAPYELELPSVLVVARVASTEQLDQVDMTVRAQSGVRARLVVVTQEAAVAAEAGRREVGVAEAGASLADLTTSEDAGVAVLDARDWYGPTYLQDLVLASRYAGNDVVGHAGYSALVDGRVEERAVHRAYRPCSGLAARRSLVLPELAARTGLAALLDDPAVLDAATQLTVDRFDYLQDGAGADPDVVEPLRGVLDLDTGAPVADVLREIDRTPAMAPDRPVISHEVLLGLRTREQVTTRRVRGGVRVTSRMEEDQRTNVWIGRPFPIAALWPDHDVRYSIESEGAVEVAPFIRFFDEHGTALASVTRHANVAVHLTPPEGAVSCRLGVRFIGRGEATVSAFNVGPDWGLPTARPGTGRVLVLTNAYPAYDDLYRNGFVHARVRTYLQDGLSLDVFRYAPTMPQSYAEFEGVEVTTGNDADLHRVLEEGDYDTVLVHFLLAGMWDTLRPHADRLRVVVWLHGAEVQPWWRREFNYETPEALEAAKPASDARLALWRGLVDDLPDRTSFVFVSQYFADEVMTDLERTFPADRVSIVHNPVDTDIFRYVPKPPEQRTRILSIRPYATRKYANDLSVAAVLELSKEPWFDELEFRFVGDGTLFDEVLEPIRDLPNVTVQQGFLTQPEIAELHREYGVFLVPTRMDAQGVSKDEAMASGLVPVTNAVAAIPEFVSDAEGYLAPPDDASGMADAIRDLYHHPEVFAAKSAAAAARVRAQTSADVVVPAEIALIRGERPDPAAQDRTA
jgi:glycosyltransferase involved in cell wall biosynthesis/spore maturation protein CgeB